MYSNLSTAIRFVKFELIPQVLSQRTSFFYCLILELDVKTATPMLCVNAAGFRTELDIINTAYLHLKQMEVGNKHHALLFNIRLGSVISMII